MYSLLVLAFASHFLIFILNMIILWIEKSCCELWMKKSMYDTTISGKWGYCSLDCIHQNRTKVDRYTDDSNIALPKYDEFWEEKVSFIHYAIGEGHCHTYNPMNRSSPVHNGELYALFIAFSIRYVEFPLHNTNLT